MYAVQRNLVTTVRLQRSPATAAYEICFYSTIGALQQRQQHLRQQHSPTAMPPTAPANGTLLMWQRPCRQVRLLLRYKPDTNLQGKGTGMIQGTAPLGTALHVACAFGHVESLQECNLPLNLPRTQSSTQTLKPWPAPRPTPVCDAYMAALPSCSRHSNGTRRSAVRPSTECWSPQEILKAPDVDVIALNLTNETPLEIAITSGAWHTWRTYHTWHI
jgi:hypothetical protein